MQFFFIKNILYLPIKFDFFINDVKMFLIEDA